MQIDPAPRKGIRATGQIQTPDTQCLLRHQFRRSFEVILQSLTPVIERARVVQAQAFDIDDFQPGFTDLG